MSTCCCDLVGTAACKYCTNNPDAIAPPVVQYSIDVGSWPLTVNKTLDKILWSEAKTNADRIRSKSDKELAEWLVMIERKAIKKAMLDPQYYTDEELKADWLDWLKQEVDYGD